jgi:peroxiredoxin
MLTQEGRVTMPEVKVGDLAPDFTLSGAQGDNKLKFTLSERRGKQHTVLAFFPAAFTPV